MRIDNINHHCDGGWNWNCVWGIPYFSMRLGEAPGCVTNCLPLANGDSESAELLQEAVLQQIKRRRQPQISDEIPVTLREH